MEDAEEDDPSHGSAAATVSFLFTDVAGSTRLWQEHPIAMAADLELHDHLVRTSIEVERGTVFSTAGDSFAASFRDVRAAERAARSIQAALDAAAWQIEDGLKVRIGIHHGTAQARDGDWFGPDVNLAARVMDAGHGGQVLLSGAAIAAGAAGDLDLGLHRLRDVQQEVHLYQLRLEGEPREFPPLRTLSATSSLLPSYRTQLVARDDEIDAVRTSLTTSRLVTVVGVGGVGKTRLAVEVAAQDQARNGSQAVFVDLASVADDAGVNHAVLAGFGVVGDPGAPPLEQVRALIGQRPTVLVVDNCEHVLDGASDAIDEILDACPKATVLATSREALCIHGEQVVPLAPITDREALRRLFVDRALAADSGFDPDAHWEAVDEICARLDGLPLAIELAASRTRVLSPEQIVEHLNDRFALLGGGRRRGVRRQRTLGAAIEWSYDLLEPGEQDLLRRCSVCVGGFTLEAAAALGDVDLIDAVDLIDSLVAKSLVQAIDGEAGRRYVMLETIREFGIDRLDAAGDVASTRERHIEHHLADLRSRSGGLVVDRSLDALRPDTGNLCAAVDWSLATGETAPAAALVIGASDLWISSIAGVEVSRSMLPRLLELDDLTAWDRGLLLALSSVLDMIMLEEGDSAWPVLAEQAIELLEGRPTGELVVALCQSTVFLSAMAPTRALERLDEAEEVVRAIGDPPYLTAWVGIHRGFVLANDRRFDEALGELIDASRLVPPGRSVAHGMVHASIAEVVACQRGDPAHALEACDEAMGSFHSSFWGLFDGTRRALALGRAGQLDEAARVLADDVERFGGRAIGAMGNTHRLALAVIADGRGDRERARRIMGALDPTAGPAVNGAVGVSRTPISTSLVYEVLADLEGWPADEFDARRLASLAVTFSASVPASIREAADLLIASEVAALDRTP